MWYVMQVVPGHEKRTVLLVKERVSEEALETCFVPMRRLKKKHHGIWHEITEKLFPGYVFLITEKPQLLYEELKKIPILTKMLGRCEDYFIPLPEAEVQIIKKMQSEICGNGNLEIEISKIVMEEKNQIKILSGPLVNLKGQIKNVNLHKRIAEVEIEFMGSQSVVYLGVEMVKKIR